MEDGEVILGIDPGTGVTGYGLITSKNNQLKPIDYGCIRPPTRFKLSERYLIIYNSIEELIRKYEPSVLVVEMQFMYKNPQSALKLGMARGVAMVVAKKLGLSVFEYTPTVAKRAVVGNGRASKYQVQKMVQQLLRLAAPPEPDDAADALALAICHAHAAPHVRINREV